MLEQVMQILLGLGGAAYLLAYLMCGWWIIRCLLPRHSPLTRLWLGMGLGLLMMMWLPALLAFGVDFTMTAHLLALIPLAGLTAGVWFLRDKRPVQKPKNGQKSYPRTAFAPLQPPDIDGRNRRRYPPATVRCVPVWRPALPPAERGPYPRPESDAPGQRRSDTAV